MTNRSNRYRSPILHVPSEYEKLISECVRKLIIMKTLVIGPLTSFIDRYLLVRSERSRKNRSEGVTTSVKNTE